MEYMEQQLDYKKGKVREGIAAGLPIAIGYLPVAMAFGLLAKAVGVSLTGTFLFSLLVFAGASQFMALNLISTGIAAGEIILATLLLNMRHLLMSASLAARLRDRRSKWLPMVSFGITDETFSVAATREGELETPFLLALNGIAYSAWVGGSLVGYIAGEILPASIQNSMAVALYALFVAILVPEIRKCIKIALLAGGAGLINIILNKVKILPSGWNLVTAIAITAFLGALFLKGENGEVEG